MTYYLSTAKKPNGYAIELLEDGVDEGGEARVSPIKGENLVAKIYHDFSNSSKNSSQKAIYDRLQKLVVLHEALEKQLPFASWPSGLIFSSKQTSSEKDFSGYAMKRFADYEPLSSLITNAPYNRVRSQKMRDNPYSLLTVLALCAHNLHQLHSFKLPVVVSDMKPENIMVRKTHKKSDQPFVVFIDTDSFCYGTRDEALITNNVHSPGYMSITQIRNQRRYGMAMTNGQFCKPYHSKPEDDNFVFGILIFQTLIGINPYQTPGHSNVNDNIEQHRSYFCSFDKDLKPLQQYIDRYNCLDSQLKTAINLCLRGRTTPSAKQWQDLLVNATKRLSPSKADRKAFV